MAVRNSQSKIKVSVSSCLLGEPVRWNEEHKLNSYLKNALGRLLGAGPIPLKRYGATPPLTSPTLYRAGNLLTANYKRASQGTILNLSPALRWPAAVRRLQRRYAEAFMQALTYKTTVKKNADVLVHMLGMFKKQLTERERREIIEAIENYRNGSASLIKPVTRIKRHARKHKVETLMNQVYLHPHPKEWMLRNHV